MTMKTRYTVIDGEVIAEERNGVRKLYVPDPLGSTVALLDNTQAQTDTFSYWPYGEDAGRTGTTSTPFQYVGTLGYYCDSSTRDYVRARVLNMAHGRWLTQDPIGVGGADNLYSYVTNNPIVAQDPTGLSPNCTPVVYMCYRSIVGGVGNHEFFWIHYPCSPGTDTTIGYGPGGFIPGKPAISDDNDEINTGHARCHRTNCKAGCVIEAGGHIKIGDPEWDPGRFSIPHQHDCHQFKDYVLDKCKCKFNLHGFEPDPRQKYKLPVNSN